MPNTSIRAMSVVPLLLCFCSLAATTPIGYSIVDVENYTAIASHGNSTLYAVDTTPPNAYASGKVVLLDLHGSRKDQGFAFGALQGKESKLNYDALILALLNNPSVVGKIEQGALESLIDHQWAQWLSKQVPARFMDEIAGFTQGCLQALGNEQEEWCNHALGRILVLANLPGSVKDVAYILLDEKNLPRPEYERLSQRLGQDLTTFVQSLDWPLAQCSMFGVWGKRTKDGDLYSGRNLDWNQNTGINKNKLVTVFHPPEAGLHAHATIGFAGVYGALAGMSSAGLTTHEANLETNLDSFRGFPWLLRLRYVMEGADDLQSALALWNATNNTVGFNHMIGSAKDKSAVVMETNAKHTGFFGAMDPIEKAANIPSGNGTMVTGAPLPEAVFRSNHGFDPEIVSHFMWNKTEAYADSDLRYHLMSKQIAEYEAEGTVIGPVEAVNITSLVGQKGSDYYHCNPGTGGSNVLSVAYFPAGQKLWAAWEDGQNATWTPAACAAYVEIDFSRWF